MQFFTTLAFSVLLAAAASAEAAEAIKIPVEASQPVGSRTPAQTKEALIEALTLQAAQKVPRTAIASSLIKDGMSEQSVQLISGAAVSLGDITWGSSITDGGEITMTAKAMATADLEVNEQQLVGVRASLQAQQQIAALTRQLDIKQRELDALATRMAGISGEDAAPLLVAQSRLIADISALRQKGYSIAITTTTGTLGDAVAAEHSVSTTAAGIASTEDEAGRLIREFKSALATYIASCAPSGETPYHVVVSEEDAYRLKTARTADATKQIIDSIHSVELKAINGVEPRCDPAKRMAAYAVLAPAFLGGSDQIESRAGADYWGWLDAIYAITAQKTKGARVFVNGPPSVAAEDMNVLQRIRHPGVPWQSDRFWYGFMGLPHLRVYPAPTTCNAPTNDWYRAAELSPVAEYRDHPNRACQRANPVAYTVMERLKAESHDGSVSCGWLGGIAGFAGDSSSRSSGKVFMQRGGGLPCNKQLTKVFGGSVMSVDFRVGDEKETVEIYSPAAAVIFGQDIGELAVATRLDIPPAWIKYHDRKHRHPLEAVGIRVQFVGPSL